MPAFVYRYVFRPADQTFVTGHLRREEALAAGEEVVIGGRRAVVWSIVPLPGERELHLVLIAV